jgi:hypothetical protein
MNDNYVAKPNSNGCWHFIQFANIENMAMPSWIQGYTIYNSSIIISDVYVFDHLLGKGE